MDYLKILVTVFLASLGWLVAHYFTNKRIIASKQRDLITTHLIESYQVLAFEISQRKPSPEIALKLEELVADIQLFGSAKQIQMIQDLAIVAASGADFDLDPLIKELRNDLRERLALEAVTGNVQWVRLNAP